MPLTAKGQEILAKMKKEYGEEKGTSVFYASANKGTITGVHDEAGVMDAALDMCSKHDAADPIGDKKVKDLETQLVEAKKVRNKAQSEFMNYLGTGSTGNYHKLRGKHKDAQAKVEVLQRELNRLSLK